jgi:putative ABC transport system substrate-binding protein
MNRREMIAGLAGAAAWPIATRAQQAGRLPTIGFLGAGTPSPYKQLTAAFVQRLRELGWIEERTVAIEYRWAEGRSERLPVVAAEFVRLKVDVMGHGGNSGNARRKAGDIDHPYRLSGVRRSGQRRASRKPSAAGQQCYRSVDPAD